MFDFNITWKALEEKNLKQMGNNNIVVFYKGIQRLSATFKIDHYYDQ